MRVLILGAGGVGGFFGGHLAQAGAEVTFLVREQRAAQLRQSGLAIDSALGNVRLTVSVATDASGIARPDVVVLACKACDLPQAIEAVAPVVGPTTAVLPLLNGLAHIDRLCGRFLHSAVWGGLAHLAVTLADDGTVRHLNTLSTIQFGPRGGAIDVRAQELANLFSRTPVEASARPTIEQDMWNKFVFLSTLAGMTCLMRSSVGAIMSTASGERLMLQLLDECRAVAVASGFPPADEQLVSYRSQLTQKGSVSKASMLRDIERGSRTEGEHIIGDMIARSRCLGVKAPLLEVAAIHLEAHEASRLCS